MTHKPKRIHNKNGSHTDFSQTFDSARKKDTTVSSKSQDDAPMILCLCSICAVSFYDSREYHIKQKDPLQVVMDTCTYCQRRKGLDYLVTKKKRK